MRYGFAHEVVAPEMLLNRARELAGHLASKSQFAFRYTRMALNQSWRNRFATEASYGFVVEMLSLSTWGGQHELDLSKLRAGKPCPE